MPLVWGIPADSENAPPMKKISGTIAKRIHNSVDLFRNAGLVVSSKTILIRLPVQKRGGTQ
jgi:hypothetical protein